MANDKPAQNNPPDSVTFAPSPLPPPTANATPQAGAAPPSASQDPAPTPTGLQPGPSADITPNMASTPAGSVATVTMSSAAPRVAPAEPRSDSRTEGGIVLSEPAPADDGAQPESVATQTAKLLRGQIDIITQRIYFDSQELMRVSALAPDPITVRTMVVGLAAALEQGDRATFAYIFGRANRGISPQINDQVIPLHSGLALGGIIDGVLRDTIKQGFKEDANLRDQALDLLDAMTSPAYPALLHSPSYLERPQAPKI